MGLIGSEDGALERECFSAEPSNSPGRIAWNTELSWSTFPPLPLFEREGRSVGIFSIECMVLESIDIGLVFQKRRYHRQAAEVV